MNFAKKKLFKIQIENAFENELKNKKENPSSPPSLSAQSAQPAIPFPLLSLQRLTSGARTSASSPSPTAPFSLAHETATGRSRAPAPTSLPHDFYPRARARAAPAAVPLPFRSLPHLYSRFRAHSNRRSATAIHRPLSGRTKPSPPSIFAVVSAPPSPLPLRLSPMRKCGL